MKITRNCFIRAAVFLALFAGGKLAQAAASPDCSKAWARLVSVGKTSHAVGSYLVGQTGPVFHFRGETGPLRKTARLAEDVTNLLLRNLFLPGLTDHLDGPTRRIFRKQWAKPAYDPSPEEVALLEQYKTYDSFMTRRAWLITHPSWHRVRRGLGIVGNAALKMAYLLAANLAQQILSDEKGLLAADEYLDDKTNHPADDEVQLLVDTAPLPHMAIRIGDRVYSYGVSHLTAMPAAQYIRMKDLMAIVKRGNGNAAEPRTTNLQGSSVKLVERTGLANVVSRSIQVITLKVGKERRDATKRYLEMQVGKRYDNVTMVNDCSTMTLRALRLENPWYDFSPSGVAMIFALRKSLGDKTIGRIFQVSVDNPDHARAQLGRNVWINSLDATLHLNGYFIVRQDRAVFDYFKTPEQIQYYDAEIQAVIDGFRDEFKDLVEGDDEMQLLNHRAHRCRDMPDSDPEKEAFRKQVLGETKQYFDEKLDEAQQELESRELRQKQVLYAQFKLHLLPVYRAEILDVLKRF